MGLKKYEENGSTASFDVFLDKFFYEKLYDGYVSLQQKRADLTQTFMQA